MKRVFIFLLSCLLTLGTLGAQDLVNIADKPMMDAVSMDSITLADYSDADLYVLIFTSNFCPYSRKYEDRIAAISERFGSEVQVFLINPNQGENDNLEAMQAKAEERNYKVPYLSDKEQSLTTILGARRTPEAFLFRRNGMQLLYRGAIDDNPQAPQYVEESYLISSIQKTLDGEPIVNSQEKVIGCMIKKSN